MAKSLRQNMPVKILTAADQSHFTGMRHWSTLQEYNESVLRANNRNNSFSSYEDVDFKLKVQ
jgi:hypothetical protein